MAHEAADHPSGPEGPPSPERRGVLHRLDVVLFCALVAVCAAVVAGFAWSRPAVDKSVLHYRQSGVFSYSAPASPTSIYGASGLVTGEPVYSNVVSTVRIAFVYHLTLPTSAQMSGTEQLLATMRNSQGISRSIPLQPPTSFTGNHFTAAGTLQLATLQSLVKAFDLAEGRSSSPSYPLSISPNVAVRGRLGSVAISTAYDQAANFQFGSGILTVISPNGGSGSGSTGSFHPGSTAPTTAKPSFAATSTGTIVLPSGKPATLFLGLSVLDLRVVALGILALALAAGVLSGWPLWRDATSADERRRIVARHGPSLIEVGAIPEGPGTVLVALTTFEGLVQVAQRTECPLLHADLGEAGHAYGVVDNGTVYRYGSRAPTTSLPGAWANGIGSAHGSANGSAKPTHLAT